MYKGVIFDMDGLLIDSEPFWVKAQGNVLKLVGITLTDEMALETSGLKIIEALQYRYEKFPWNMIEYPLEKVADLIVTEVIYLVETSGTKKQGVEYIFKFFRDRGYKIAINSASDYVLINSVIAKCNLGKYIDIIHSGEEEQYGKPHPSGYMNTCKKMGLEVNQCIAFEDSLNGILSVKSSKIKCVAIPAIHNKDNNKFNVADLILDSLDQFDEQSLCGL